MTTKPSHRLSLKDRLSQLNYVRACQLLGPEGKQLLQSGSHYDQIDLENDVYFKGDLFRLRLPAIAGPDAVVTITLAADARDRLKFNCTACDTACSHLGAAFSLILEDKYALGLSSVPVERAPIESLGEAELEQTAVAERAERAKSEKFRLQSAEPDKPWTDYTITSNASGKSYRVALRGLDRGQSYCNCPDFRTNTLGTCKHVLHALDRIRRKFNAAALRRPYRSREPMVYVLYGKEQSLHFHVPAKMDEAARIAAPLTERPIEDVHKLMLTIGKLESLGIGVTVYPDAEELIQRRLFQLRIANRVREVRANPARHALRKELLKTELLPYQLDGIAFAAGAGRAILADDMGLGKTIQGIGVAEFLAREAGIRKVLVICPTSLKSQWRNEITRFSDRDVQLVVGGAAARATQYDNSCFFTICNYEQVLRDILPIEKIAWDLIVLDEGQRIKNWESKTSRIIKGLRSTFALVLTGTPLENRLDDLFSVAQFVDDRRLGPAFRFMNRHRIVDENGRVLGYKNLDTLRETLRPILLRRTRDAVLEQLPPRTTEIVRIPPTDEQLAIHSSHMHIVSMITKKKFLTEMDLLRLQKALLMCRLVANSTYLVDKKKPAYSTKLQHLAELLEQLFAEQGRKAVLFSEWTTMLDQIEPLLKKLKLDYVRLDGSVPQQKRQELVNRFQNDASCRLFITTNAGSTGLNLQAANTVINVDLPWNPAVLEQRIARAHRMGQRQPVQVYVLVTEQTLEENLLSTLAAKHDLALAVLDTESDVSQVDLVSGIEELKRRLEVLLGAKPNAPLDETQRNDVQQVIEQTTVNRERLAAAGGELLGAAFGFLGTLVSGEGTPPPPAALVTDLHQRLSQCVEEDPSGQQRITFSLPDRGALEKLAQTLAQLLQVGNQTGNA